MLRILKLVDHLDLLDRIAFLLSDATVGGRLDLTRPLQFGAMNSPKSWVAGLAPRKSYTPPTSH